MDRDKLVEQLIRHEGIRLKPYQDSVGKTTIGVGRNLEDVGISKDEAMYLLDGDIDGVILELENCFPWYTDLNEVRQRVLADMLFNVGLNKLKSFRKTLRAIESGNYEEASKEMLDSLWARQVGVRAVRLSEMMRTGEDK